MRVVIAATIVLILVAACNSSPAPKTADDQQMVLPPGASVSGRSVAEFTGEWWQWAMAMPDDLSPVRDRTGVNCGMGQQGDVWFLAGGFGSSKIHRVCTIPYGKTLLFPVVNMSYYPSEGNSSYTCEEAKASAALNNDTALELFVELDGVAIEGVKQHRVSSERCFNMFGRIPAAQRPYEAYPAASDGYWMVLKPLAPGRHVLKFGGRYNRASGAFGRMVQDIEYEITVGEHGGAT